MCGGRNLVRAANERRQPTGDAPAGPCLDCKTPFGVNKTALRGATFAMETLQEFVESPSLYQPS
ncbi:hypothetical protein [Streptomyces coerulescens]|uniref:Uncharacterized protein n=1 Tax=Streptomyces coerulescens TaxID=29304 RepID=A0ABW0CWJ3_STRCD